MVPPAEQVDMVVVDRDLQGLEGGGMRPRQWAEGVMGMTDLLCSDREVLRADTARLALRLVDRLDRADRTGMTCHTFPLVWMSHRGKRPRMLSQRPSRRYLRDRCKRSWRI